MHLYWRPLSRQTTFLLWNICLSVSHAFLVCWSYVQDHQIMRPTPLIFDTQPTASNLWQRVYLITILSNSYSIFIRQQPLTFYLSTKDECRQMDIWMAVHRSMRNLEKVNQWMNEQRGVAASVTVRKATQCVKSHLPSWMNPFVYYYTIRAVVVGAYELLFQYDNNHKQLIGLFKSNLLHRLLLPLL